VRSTTQQKLARRKRRMARRLSRYKCSPRRVPVFSARNIHYQIADRALGLGCGGIGAIHQVARQTGLIDAIDEQVRVLKVHLPYHESDHVLNIAYNVLAGGRCLDHLELLRNDEGYLNALGASRIPDPTTAGDFCRRFENEQQILTLMETINEVRLKVWKQQEPEFFARAILDADGTIAPTTGQCKQGMNISYDGQWGYHPLVVSLANTREPLYLLNRPGNRPSHEGADEYLDKAVTLCRRAGFQRILLRGDTDFMQTWKLDAWDKAGDLTFIFGADARKEMIAQLKDTGTGSMRNPLDNLHSNWAYMVMSSLAWTLKAWCGLLLPVTPGAPAIKHAEQKKSIVKMEFTTFVNGLIRLPCQIIKSGRRIIYRLMSWNPWLSPLLRLSERLHQPLRC
jgi:DDE family transposase